MALSLYRKYRPEVFADVVGQEHVEKTLINAISEGAVAHAYLFCGPRGTGKTTSARLLAKALLCESAQNGQPDGACPQCLEIAQGTHPDVFELDAASRTGVDNVREEIIGRVGFAPTRGRFKVYIIDEVHMLSTAAFNALLKTLEEPPEHVVFVLCTTDPHKVPETIQSRCQRFDFRRFSVEEIVGYLERISKGEGFEYEPEALEFIAAKSAGGMRDATTALEQVGVYTEGKITLDEATRMFGQIDIAALFEIAGYIVRRDTPSCFVWINDLVGRGVDLAQFARDLASHLRNLYVTAITGGENGIVACTAAQLERYRQQAVEFGGCRPPRACARYLRRARRRATQLRRCAPERRDCDDAPYAS
ncbi:MAG TPA: DNA polymerase III subunit gamma/tau [Coriobacteriaceae bacterium]|nr:DNA polymerase III subunit gamma/tau [Coriobacteriaceae bacterium]